jgi:hypothetical protein
MATPSEKLAESLERLKELQDQGTVAIRSRDLSRTHRERLVKNGFLQEVIKGWYIPARPVQTAGESTLWYASFWEFCASYLESRFGQDWCLSPEQSLALHTGNMTVPKQLLVRTKKETNNVTNLPHDTSLLDIRAELPDEKATVITEGLRLFSLPAALIACAPASYRQKPTDLRTALAMIGDASEILELLLEGGNSTIAGRLAGAFRNIGRGNIADDLVNTMKAAGYEIRENDPFETASPLIFSKREKSPYVVRINLMWHNMRETILEEFPEAPGISPDKESYLKKVSELYTSDAYHSLSKRMKVIATIAMRWQRVAIGKLSRRSNKALRKFWTAITLVSESIRIMAHGTVNSSCPVLQQAF